MRNRGQMRLGALSHGVGITHWMWRQPKLPPNASIDFGFYYNMVRVIEDAKFDFFFLTDSPFADKKTSPHGLNKLEPLTTLSALSALTSKIGLVGTASTSYRQPFNVARQYASLDNISGGRAGWNIVTTAVPGAAYNFGADDSLPHDERYIRAAEHVQVVKGLWDSWEDDAFVYDKDKHIFFDPEKFHALNFVGDYYQVRGPLDIQRSPQGHPVLFQAGASGTGQDFASRYADAIFSGTRSLKDAQAYYAAVQHKARGFGRSADIVVMSAIGPIVGETDAEADEIYREMVNLVTLDEALAWLSHTFGGHDFSQYDPDALFPELGDTGLEAYRDAATRFTKLAKDNDLTLRATALRIATPRPQFVGNPVKIADTMQHWFDSKAADGFILGLGTVAEGVEAFVKLVVPILQERGLFRTEYEGSTLRENLGLPIPENVHTMRARKATG